MQAPKIDKRSYDDVVAEAESHLQEVSGWQPGAKMDAGGALTRIFGRFAEVIIERLNQVPEKSFLAFLNLIGADITPPQPARVPLTFQLAAGSPVDAFVPARTQVAAPPAEGETEEVVFETERDLLVTQAQLTAVFARDFAPHLDQDRYGEYTQAAAGAAERPFPFFAGENEMEHCLYLACDALLKLRDPANVTLTFHADDAAQLQTLPISWSYWDAKNEAWRAFPAADVTARTQGGKRWIVTIKDCPPLQAGEVHGREGGWLRLQLNLPLPPPEEDLPLQAIATGSSSPSLPAMPTHPFDADGSNKYFYVNAETAFARRGATASLDVTLAVAGAGKNVALRWDYLATDDAGKTDWKPLSVTDGTNGLAQNGRIQFRVPADGSWQLALYRNWSGFWCRFAVDKGSYTHAPQIAAITSAYHWDLPAVRQIDLSLPNTRPALLADTGYCNSLSLDMSKDFYPFGAEPRFNDTFYLGYGAVLGEGGLQAGDSVRIDVALTTPGTPGGSGSSGSVTLAWEFWNGRSWQTLGQSDNTGPLLGSSAYAFQDNTHAFTQAGTLHFTLPTAATPHTVNGVEDYWLRTRIVAGDYGSGAGYAPYTITISGSEVTAYKLTDATYAPPLVTTLHFDVSARMQFPLAACLAANDFTIVDHTPSGSDPDAAFTPFRPTTDAVPALYLGFDRPFDNRSVTLYVQTAPPAPESVTPDRFQLAGQTDAPQVVWEYAKGDGWSRLGVTDETNAFTNRGLIRFIGPGGFSSRMLFGRKLYWLRVRWQRGHFAVFPHGVRLALNTMWASQTTTFNNELLGSGNGQPGQFFQTTQQPVLPGQQLEVREPDVGETALAAMLAAGGVTITRDAAGNIDEVWVHWQEVRNFYHSGANDRHYTLDHLSGTVRFGDGQQGMVPPAGQNNIRLRQYRSGGGLQGNRAADTIVQLKTSIPYVDSVINAEAAAGGAAQESLASVKRYGPRTLRHRGRAVTVDDIEDLAFEASSTVARARAIPPRFRPLDLWLEPGNTSPDLAEHELVNAAGSYGLIIVPNSDEAQPAPDTELLERVRAFLLQRTGATSRLWVSGPEWMAVTVAAAIVPTSLKAADFVGEQVVTALERFLHPLTGGFAGKGWAFGRRPYRSDLFTLIESIASVDHVRHLAIAELPEADRLPPGRFLIYSGQHQVDVILDEF